VKGADDKARRGRILIIDDDPSIREGCRKVLSTEGYLVDVSETAGRGIDRAAGGSYDVILLDLRLPDMLGIDAIPRIKEKDSDPVIVMITGYPTVATAVDAAKRGVYDYIPKPFTPDQLLFHVERAVGKRLEDARSEELRRRLELREKEVRIVDRSRAMKKVLELVEKVAPSDSTVMITGESGTGKEVVARHIHAMSTRKNSEFVAVDCSALVEGLIESELFGHVKGAFTGAFRSRRGSMELASGGTFFFDEISNLSLSVQAKILRTIQEREIRRVGDTRPITVNVRILAATNLDLGNEVRSGRFREDLFYRLNVFPIRMPPLRERREDIRPLADEFLGLFARRKRKPITGFSVEAEDFLMTYGWPGNVRELRNMVERAVILEEGEAVTLPSMLVGHGEGSRAEEANRGGEEEGAAGGSVLLRDVEARHILRVLESTGWNKRKTARLLGIDKKTLVSKIRRYKIEEG
jgi:two-component system response regulator HydG